MVVEKMPVYMRSMHLLNFHFQALELASDALRISKEIRRVYFFLSTIDSKSFGVQ